MNLSASQQRPTACGNERNTLNVYLDDAGAFDLMSAEDERRMARQLRELRQDVWRCLMALPSCVDGVLTVVERMLPNAVEPSTYRQARAALAAYERDAGAATGRALTRALEALAVALGDADLDRVACDAVLEDLEAIACGARSEHGLQLPHRPEAAAFVRYCRRVQRSQAALQAVRERFICANLRLVVRVAQRYGRHHMALSDRVQEGNLGLMKAVDRFDGERGIRFSTYAAWWIRHNITRALVNRARNVRVPAHLHTVFSKFQRAQRSLRGQLGREPTLEEISTVIKVPVTKVRVARDAMELRSVALEAPDRAYDGKQPLDTLVCDSDFTVDRVIDDRRNAAVMRGAFEHLEPMERDILRHRFGLEGNQKMTLQSLGERYSLSRERIRQVQNQALAKLRQVIEASPVPAIAFA